MVADISTYYENLRTLLGDAAIEGAFQYSNAQLDGAIRTVLQSGLGPRGVAVAEDPTKLDPAPATPDARGYMVAKAALLMVGGNTLASFKTRALSVTVVAGERRETILHIRRLLADLEAGGDPHGIGGASFFGIWADLENYLGRTLPVVTPPPLFTGSLYGGACPPPLYVPGCVLGREFPPSSPCT